MYYPSLEEIQTLADSGQYRRIPICRELYADRYTPVEVMRRLRGASRHCFMLESASQTEVWGRYTFLGYQPTMEITCTDGQMKIRKTGPDGQTQQDGFTVTHPGDTLRSILAQYRSPILEKMPPFLTGGEMIETVSRYDAVYAELPHKFEAGTVNAGGAVGLAAAIDYLESYGMDKLHAVEQELTAYLFRGMKAIPHIHVLGSDREDNHTGIVSFAVDQVHPHDISEVLSSDGMDIRAGHHCAQPLHDHLGVHSTARASLMFYNTKEEIDRFLESVSNIRRRMGFGNE